MDIFLVNLWNSREAVDKNTFHCLDSHTFNLELEQNGRLVHYFQSFWISGIFKPRDRIKFSKIDLLKTRKHKPSIKVTSLLKYINEKNTRFSPLNEKGNLSLK